MEFNHCLSRTPCTHFCLLGGLALSQSPSLLKKQKSPTHSSLDSSSKPLQKGSVISPGSTGKLWCSCAAARHTTQQTAKNKPQGTIVPQWQKLCKTGRRRGQRQHGCLASFWVIHLMLFSHLNPAYVDWMNKSIKAFGTPWESPPGLWSTGSCPEDDTWLEGAAAQGCLAIAQILRDSYTGGRVSTSLWGARRRAKACKTLENKNPSCQAR